MQFPSNYRGSKNQKVIYWSALILLVAKAAELFGRWYKNMINRNPI